MREKDITQKDFFEDDRRFADLMNAVCFHGRKVLKAEELITAPEAVRKADEKAVMERFCDVVKKQTKDGCVYAIYVLENQETVDYRMLVRVMLEESMAYDRQTKEIGKQNRREVHTSGSDMPLTDGEYLYGFCKSDRLTPVYTIVVYWGEKEWDAANSLRELVEIPVEDEELRQEMRELLPDYKIKVFDLNKERDFTAFETSLKTIFEFYGARRDKDELKDYMDTHKEEVEKLDRESRFFLATMLGQKKLKKELLEEKKEDKEERSMCKAIDDMIEEGIQQGIEKGRAEAEQTITELRKELEEQKEKSNCKAIDDMIEEGIQQGIEKGRAEAEQTITELRKELAEQKEKSNCKAIDEMIEEGYQKGRAEAEQTIFLLKKEKDEKDKELILLRQELERLNSR